MAAASSSSNSLFFASSQFSDLGLDTRLWKALASAHMARLTLVQESCIPHILQGSNVLVQAKTGSGKTLAYAVPAVQQILLQQSASGGNEEQVVTHSTKFSCIILVPTLELCQQVSQQVKMLSKYCDDTLRVVSLKTEHIDPTLLRENPDIIIATPSQLLKYCQASSKRSYGGFLADLPHQLKHLIIDEADVVIASGYDTDLNELLNNSKYLGSGFQISLFSATLDEQIEQLKNLYMPTPVVTIKIKEPTGSALGGRAKLTQFYHKCANHQDKFFMTLTLLQTQILSVAAKILIFIDSIQDAYKLKLFLEQFSISSAVLNHELPRNSRMSILDHFNRGLIDILIATDEASGNDVAEETAAVKEEEEEGKKPSAQTKGKKRSNTEMLSSSSSALKDEPFEAPTFGPTAEVTIEHTRSGPKKKKAKVEEVEKKEKNGGKSKKGKKQQVEEEDEAEEEEDEDGTKIKIEEDEADTETEGEDEEEDEEMNDDEDDENNGATPSASSKINPHTLKKQRAPESTEEIDAALAEMTSMEKSAKKADKKAARKERSSANAAAASSSSPHSSSASSSKFGSSNVSRGIDFKDVGTVLNFDLPRSATTYTHRIGRTARANKSGVALSLVEPKEQALLDTLLFNQYEARNGMAIEHSPGDLQELPFDNALLDGLRYRCNDKIRSVTSIAIREARLKEIKNELLNSERLRSHFEDNPRELALLKHDQVLRTKGIQSHLAVLPKYLLPEEVKTVNSTESLSVQSGQDKNNRNKLRRNKHKIKQAMGNKLAKQGGHEGLKGYALAKAKGRHTKETQKALSGGDPLKTFRAKPISAAAATSGSNSQKGKAKVDF